jgi:hypothetical protein
VKPPKPEKRLRNISVQTRRRPNFCQITPEYVDIITAHSAQQGDRQPLISMLLDGEEVGPFCRAFLIADLSGAAPRKRGNKKCFSQAQQDLAVFVRVIYAMVDNQITKNAALAIIADKLASETKPKPIPFDTLRSQFKRAEKNMQECMPIKVDGKWILPWLT